MRTVAKRVLDNAMAAGSRPGMNQSQARVVVLAMRAAAIALKSSRLVAGKLAAAAVPPGEGAAGGKGATVFANSCSGCHGANGQGQPGAFPPLAKNPHVTGDPTEVIHTVLYGRAGALQVNGSTYNGQMPAWKGQLSNADIAAAITYIRSSWGNNASAVTEAQVAAVKK